MSSKTTYLISGDTLKTVCQGALGAMSFGAYHQFTTNKIMEINDKENKFIMSKMEEEIQELKQELREMKNTKKSWF